MIAAVQLSYTYRAFEAARQRVKGVVRVPSRRCECGGIVWLSGRGLSGSRYYCDRCEKHNG